MNQKAFTLVELLVVVVIVGTLAAVSLPIYTRSIERSRATEAMTNIKAINESVYAYYARHETCPEKFSQLVVTLSPDTSVHGNVLTSNTVKTKFFTFVLGGAPRVIPGTNSTCAGVVAKRRNGGYYQYAIYNPYMTVDGQASALACTPLSDEEGETLTKSRALCESLGIYKAGMIANE